jgi:hypothetical protein
MTSFALPYELLKLRALIRRQHCEHLLAHVFHGPVHLGAQGLHASLRVCARRRVSIAFVKVPQLFALILCARLEAFLYGAKLLLLSVGQVELARKSQDSAMTSFAGAFWTPSPAALSLLLAVVLRSSRLLREADGAEREDEAERQTGSG